MSEALGRLPLRPVTGKGDDLAGHLLGLRPHVEEALGALGRLERGRRGLSEAERTRAAALRRLLALAEEVE